MVFLLHPNDARQHWVCILISSISIYFSCIVRILKVNNSFSNKSLSLDGSQISTAWIRTTKTFNFSIFNSVMRENRTESSYKINYGALDWTMWRVCLVSQNLFKHVQHVTFCLLVLNSIFYNFHVIVLFKICAASRTFVLIILAGTYESEWKTLSGFCTICEHQLLDYQNTSVKSD